MDKMELNSELANYNAWLSGLYVFDAINVNLYNYFARKEGQPSKNYIEEPYNFNKTKEQLQQEKREKQEEEIKNALTKMKGALNNK